MSLLYLNYAAAPSAPRCCLPRAIWRRVELIDRSTGRAVTEHEPLQLQASTLLGGGRTEVSGAGVGWQPEWGGCRFGWKSAAPHFSNLKDHFNTLGAGFPMPDKQLLTLLRTLSTPCPGLSWPARRCASWMPGGCRLEGRHPTLTWHDSPCCSTGRQGLPEPCTH